MMRYRPTELLARYRAIRETTPTEAFFRDPAHKKTQEMWCAAHFSRGYEKHYEECVVLISDKDEQTDADFELEVRGTRHRFQVTEFGKGDSEKGTDLFSGCSEVGPAQANDAGPIRGSGGTVHRMKSKKQYELAFTVVRNAIANADPYSLLETGSPEDEFDSEVSSIVGQLPRCHSAADVAHTIARVMTSSFGDRFKAEEFMEQGQEIYGTLKAQGIVE